MVRPEFFNLSILTPAQVAHVAFDPVDYHTFNTSMHAKYIANTSRRCKLSTLGADADDFIVGIFDRHPVLSLPRHTLEDLVKGGILGYRPRELAIDGAGGLVSHDQVADWRFLEVGLLLPPPVVFTNIAGKAPADARDVPSQLQQLKINSMITKQQGIITA